MKLNYTSLQHAVEPVDRPRDWLYDAQAAAGRPRDPAPWPPGAGRLGGRPGLAGAPGRLHPGPGRGSARFAVARRRRAARSRAAGRAHHRRALPRRASTRRSRWPGPSTRPRRARLGASRSSARARGFSARRAGSGTAGWRRSTPRTPRLALGLADAPVAAAVELGPTAAPSRAQPSLPSGPGDAAARRFGSPSRRRPRGLARSSSDRAPEGGSPQAALDDLIEVCGGRHDIAVQPIDLAGYASERPAGADDGPDDRGGPAVLRRPAGRRARAGGGRGARVKRVSSKIVYEGPIATVRIDTFRYEDGAEDERQVVGHPGAVAVVAHDDEHIYLVRQPREAVGEPDLLELPAGKLDVEGETPLECARRELAEEISMGPPSGPSSSASTQPRLRRGGGDVFLATDLCRCRRRARPRASGSRWSAGRSTTSTARSRTAATRSR